MKRYLWSVAVAAGAVLVATLVRLAMAPLVGAGVPFITYFAAALVVAWFRGFRDAAFTIVLSAIAGAALILPAGGRPFGFEGQTEITAILGFVVASSAVVYLIASQREALRRAWDAEQAQAAIARSNASLLVEAQRARGELQRANHDLEQFAHSASHDLKEPLRNISIGAQLLLESQARSGSTGEDDSVRQILDSARRMHALLEGLLVYAKAAAEDEAPVEADANEVLKEVIASCRNSLDESKAMVTAGNLPPVAIPPSQLFQIFQNLIVNSIKYRSEDAPKIEIGAQARDGVSQFSVKDNGIGIDPQYREVVFGLFKRLHTHQTYPGSGIGLATCRRITERYGGRIWLADSTPGAGATFHFELPASKQER